MAEARVALAAAALATALSAEVARAEDAATVVDRLTEVEQRIDAVREDAALYGEDVAALDARLAELGRERIAAAADVQRHEAALTAIEDRLADLEARAAAASAALLAQQGSTARIAAALVRLARQPPEALLAMPGQGADVRHSGLLLAALVPAIEQRVADFGQQIEATAALRRDLAAERDAHAKAAVDLEERRAVVAALMDETAALRIQRVEERDSALDAAAALAAEAEDLRALIARLAGTATLESEAARADGLPVPDTKPDAADLAAIAPAAGTEDGGVVAALAQPLRLPVAGAITRGFGEPVGDGTRSRGLVIGAREAAQVVAPSAGTVVYAGAFKDLGQLLILAHGEEYHSVLAGFARIDVAVGQAVTSGEPVGIVGADAGGTTSLYVELRRHGEPVDPLPWLRTAFSEDIR